ncbi:transcriptional regulator, BadM/Rrf2 family [Priestia aryabhattai B8W22]|mgnify:CR=1 FL=1|uniref:Rrf2 family transcriptional regulator n=1 Tax=Priestia aryabhattai TaxID=412384 RepID=UPI0008829559|nr:transcriptional regulator, BadM/Rrf2 family [Priestia aryabhattai B8W22]
MRLTNYTDYSLRVLIFLALKKDGELSKTKEIAENYNISRNHLIKIIHQLGQFGYIETIRGRNGGIKLAKAPKEINIGEVVSRTEEDFHIVDYFQQCGDYCATSPSCKLKYALHEALQSFLEILNRYTLEDLVQNKEDLIRLFSSSLEH